MSFYKELSSVYDIVFPKDEATVKFLTVNLKKNSKVLDLACGTGTYSIALGEMDHEVTGVDLDDVMINIAKKKNIGEKVCFYVADMLELDKVVPKETFDLVYCIGNSIVHLNSIEKMEELVCDIYGRLEDQGEFIVQIINYDRILNNGIKGLPTINRSQHGVKFIRNYRFEEEGEKIYFDTELIINKASIEERYENSVPLLPIKSKDLLNILIKAGFSKIGIYGDFSKEEYKDESYALVMCAIK